MQVYYNNLKIVQDINKPFQKISDISTYGAYLVNEIRRLLKKLKFKVVISYQPSIKKRLKTSIIIYLHTLSNNVILP